MSHLMFDDIDDDDESIRSYNEILQRVHIDDSLFTSTEQIAVEKNVLGIYKTSVTPILTRNKHIGFLKGSLKNLSKNYEYLDCSRPWLCYWILHSLHILGERLDASEYSQLACFLGKCQSPEGGFGGGPNQYPHLASTYAAINALCTIGTLEAYEIIDRVKLSQFLTRLRKPDGSFCMHVDGEADIRGVYCAVVVAKLTNVYKPEMFKDSERWIASCQTWEGGFGGRPGMEAHGGYTYCGLAALVLLKKSDLLNLPAFIRWITHRQMSLEGGFQGRTNKLVDGCYSFWQGGAFPLIHAILTSKNKIHTRRWLFDQGALQEYILLCCQHANGGLLDKPGSSRDLYHTCYTLSGLSVAQNSIKPLVIGSKRENTVEIIHPVYNLVCSAAIDSLEYFSSQPIPD